MDNTARRQDDGTPQSPSPPNVVPKSTNISQSGSQRASTGPTLQGRPPYASATMTRKALSDERLDSAIPPAASQRKEPRPTNNQTTAALVAASRDRQATTEQYNVELNARSRAGKETRAAQREGVTSSATIVSANSMQLPVHPVTNSPPSRNVLPSRALQEKSSKISLLAAPPGPEETRKRNESPHPQEDSRSQRTVIRPHAEQVDRTASVRPPVKPSTSYPPLSSSSERRANTPHAEQVDRIASNQPSAKPPIPSSPPFSSSERRPHAEPVNRTASSSVQPSIKPSTTYPPHFSSSERNVTIPHAEPVNRTASVKPPAKPFTPSPPLDRSSASISPSSPPPAPAKMAPNRMHPQRDMLSYEYQAQSRESLAESPHPPLVGRGNVRPDEQARKDPSAASQRPPAPSEHTPATTKPPRQDHKDASAVPQRPPVPPEYTPTTTDLHSRQDRKIPSATSDRPPVPPEHTPATTVSPSLRDLKGASAALSDERLNSASPAAASQRKQPRPTDNQTTAALVAAFRDHQATTEQSNIELDTRSRAGKPLDADNTQNFSASGISTSKETRAAQREGVTNSGTIVSANSMQLPVHHVTSSPSSRNVLPSQALRGNSSNISLPAVPPGPEETRKRNESPHPQEDSRSQRTVTRPHAAPVNRTSSVQPPAKPSTPSPPQARNDPPAASRRPPAPSENTPATTVSPSLQDLKGASAAPSRLPVLPKDTPAPTVPPSNSPSQPVSGPGDLHRSKSGIHGNKGVDRGADRAMQGSFSVRRETYSRSCSRGYGSGEPSRGHVYMGQKERGLSSESSSLEERVPSSGSSSRGESGNEPQSPQQDQAKPSPKGGDISLPTSISPPHKRKTQQRARSGDMVNGSGEPKNSRKHTTQSQPTGPSSGISDPRYRPPDESCCTCWALSAPVAASSVDSRDLRG